MDTRFVKQDINRWFIHTSFVWRIWKWKEKGVKKKFDLWTLDFWTIFPPLIWILGGGEGDEIKSRQPSERDRTLKSILKYTYFSPFFRSPRIYWNESSYALRFWSTYSRSCYIHYIKYCCCTSVRKKNINKNQSFENLKTKHFFYSLLKICFTCEKKQVMK